MDVLNWNGVAVTCFDYIDPLFNIEPALHDLALRETGRSAILAFYQDYKSSTIEYSDILSTVNSYEQQIIDNMSDEEIFDAVCKKFMEGF